MNKVLPIISLLLTTAVIASAQPAVAQTPGSYCWKDSYGRGVGTIPSDCAFSQEKQGLLCYPKCQAGFTGAAMVCWQDCPSGYADDGAFCRKPAAYGRGWGHAWQIQDGFSNAGMLSRCQAAEGRACEMWGAIAYPTCKEGFNTFGSNVCTPACPAGMVDIGVSCAKQTTTRATLTANCAPGQVYDTGLCYTGCKQGYSGVGPVCWGTCPADKPVSCSAGCAKDMDTCAQVTADQVLSVVQSVAQIVLTVATGGGGAAVGGIQAGVKAGTKVGINAAAKSLGKNITKTMVKDTLIAQGKKVGKEVAQTTAESWAETLVTYDATATAVAAAGGDPPDFDFASLDPTGIASIVQAYNHPVCAPPPPGTAAPGPAPTPTIPAAGAPVISQAPTDWLQFPGAAKDIGVTGGGTAWVIGTGAVPGGFGIFRLQPGDSTWTQMPGGATRVAAAGDHVWVINATNNIFRWNASSNVWQLMPGWGSDVAVDEVGNAFVLGKNGTVWEMKAGQAVWTSLQTPTDCGFTNAGAPVRISANGMEQVWIVDSRGLDYKWIGNDASRPVKQQVWYYYGSQESNGVSDIAVSPDGKAFETMNSGIWSVDPRTILPQVGGYAGFTALASGGKSRLWALKADGRIYKYIGVK